MKLGVFFELRNAGPVEAARRLDRRRRDWHRPAIRIRTVIDKRMDYWGAPRGAQLAGQEAARPAAASC